MNKDSKTIAVIAASLTVAFLSCLICTVFVLTRLKATSNNVPQQKEYIYVDAQKESFTTSSCIEDEDIRIWIVKEYFDQIGVFSEEGELVRMIEIYVKTLPEADRILLREGIKLTSDKALEALIEDYTS